MNQDKIELPPLPPSDESGRYSYLDMCDAARAAVLADRERRAEQAQPAKPKVHRARWELCGDGLARLIALDARTSITNVTLCWTDDGRAWIECEDTKRHAANLRIMSANKKDYSEFAVCLAAADALDGGVR